MPSEDDDLMTPQDDGVYADLQYRQDDRSSVVITVSGIGPVLFVALPRSAWKSPIFAVSSQHEGPVLPADSER